MNSRLDKIKLIAEKTTLLLTKNQEKDERIKNLSSEIALLQNQLNTLNQDIQLVKNENENLKMATPIIETKKEQVSQKEIDQMIKEIDECLALLNI